MDTIRLRVVEGLDFPIGRADETRIFVNGRDLTDVIREIELPFARREGKPDLAGDYAGLPPEAVFFPSRRLLGRPEERYADRRGKISVLGCTCGDAGCWPLLVSIEPLEDRVVWRGFEQPHRSRWGYGGLGPFVFDRARYTAELERPR